MLQKHKVSIAIVIAGVVITVFYAQIFARAGFRYSAGFTIPSVLLLVSAWFCIRLIAQKPSFRRFLTGFGAILLAWVLTYAGYWLVLETSPATQYYGLSNWLFIIFTLWSLGFVGALVLYTIAYIIRS